MALAWRAKDKGRSLAFGGATVAVCHLRSPSYKLLACADQSTRQKRSRIDRVESLSHSVWECKYHNLAFIAKCRRKSL